MKLSSCIQYILLFALSRLSAAEQVSRLGGTISVRKLEENVTGVDETSNYTPSNETGAIVWTGEAAEKENRGDGGGGLGVCFSARSTLQVLNKGPTTMDDLRVGDYVLTKSHEYQPIYAFAHHNTHRTIEFLQLYTTGSSKKPLEMTRQHLVYKHGEIHPVAAGTIRKGDILQDDKNLGAKVVKISTVKRKGMFAPLTEDGTVVTNGIVSSCYIDVLSGPSPEDAGMSAAFWSSSHDYIHQGLSPFRLLCQISSSLCQKGNADGMPHLILFGLWLTDMVRRLENAGVQWMYQAAYGMITGLFICFEALFRTKMAILLATALLISKMVIRRKRQSEPQKEKSN